MLPPIVNLCSVWRLTPYSIWLAMVWRCKASCNEVSVPQGSDKLRSSRDLRAKLGLLVKFFVAGPFLIALTTLTYRYYESSCLFSSTQSSWTSKVPRMRGILAMFVGPVIIAANVFCRSVLTCSFGDSGQHGPAPVRTPWLDFFSTFRTVYGSTWELDYTVLNTWRLLCIHSSFLGSIL